MNAYIISVFLVVNFCFYDQSGAEDYTIISPNNKIKTSIIVNDIVQFKVNYLDEEIFTGSTISLELARGTTLGVDAKIKNVITRQVDQILKPVIREKYNDINENFNEIRLDFDENFALEFRVYNEGVAYRFITQINDSITVNSESLRLNFSASDSIYFQKSQGFASAYETPYEHNQVSEIGTEGIVCLPALVETRDGIKVLLAESDLVDYPGMWIKGTGSASLATTFAGYPLKKSYEGSPYAHGHVVKHANYIAKTNGSRTFPWRIFAIANEDKELITNQMVYMMASPNRLNDVSWIQPGVVTFDWWARRNIYNVDFKAGINTATAKYFIDFAAAFGVEYFLFDDGWTDNEDILKVNPNLNMDEISSYAKEKNVKLMVWLIWATLDKQMDEVFDMLERWDVSGIKVDFMNRDDQEMVNFYHEIASEAAKRKMVVNFHGAYKPAGLRRAYPNVLTREALIEFEYNGWTDHANPEHHNLLPFIRMVSGPMDYIPATMNNAQRDDFRKNGDHPMGLGTRAHAMALFVVLESPMQMLPDSPSDYYRERECTEFISKIPVEWDETIVLDAKIGDYVVLARRNGDDWFVAAITDWNSREFDVKFEFLDKGDYTMEYFKDGINADQRAIDYKREVQSISKSSIFHINLTSGGGWLARISKP